LEAVLTGNVKIIVNIFKVSTKADGSLDSISVSVIKSGLISFSLSSAWMEENSEDKYIKLVLKCLQWLRHFSRQNRI